MKSWIIEEWNQFKNWLKKVWIELNKRKSMESVIPGDNPSNQNSSPAQPEQEQEIPVTSERSESSPEQMDKALAVAGMGAIDGSDVRNQSVKESLLQRVEDWTEEEWEHFKNYLNGEKTKVFVEVKSTIEDPLMSALTQLQAHKVDIISKVEGAIPGFMNRITLTSVAENSAIEDVIKAVTGDIAIIKSEFRKALDLFEHLI